MIEQKSRVRRRKKNVGMNLGDVGLALDFLLGGHHRNTVVGPDFLLSRADPFNAEIGHLDPDDLRTYDQEFVDSLINLKAKETVAIPEDLKALCQTYLGQREQLSTYHGEATELIENHDVEAAKELGNFDNYLNQVVIRNEAELNVFFDYISLYRKSSGKRAIIDWRTENSQLITDQNKAVVAEFEQSKFAVLRLDENLKYGAIRATDIISQTEHILIDRALHDSEKEGCFFICSILDMVNYVMTSGSGTPIDPRYDAGKSTLTLLKKHLDKLRAAKRPINNDIIKCVREIFGFCLRGGAMKYMTVK